MPRMSVISDVHTLFCDVSNNVPTHSYFRDDPDSDSQGSEPETSMANNSCNSIAYEMDKLAPGQQTAAVPSRSSFPSFFIPPQTMCVAPYQPLQEKLTSHILG